MNPYSIVWEGPGESYEILGSEKRPFRFRKSRPVVTIDQAVAAYCMRTKGFRVERIGVGSPVCLGGNFGRVLNVEVKDQSIAVLVVYIDGDSAVAEIDKKTSTVTCVSKQLQNLGEVPVYVNFADKGFSLCEGADLDWLSILEEKFEEEHRPDGTGWQQGATPYGGHFEQVALGTWALADTVTKEALDRMSELNDLMEKANEDRGEK